MRRSIAVHSVFVLGVLCLATSAAGSAAPAPPAASAQSAANATVTEGAVRVTTTRSPEKRLDFEVVVPASLPEVWSVFTTREGMESWIAPKARVRMELGGEWEVGFAGSAPGGGTILAWLPMEMITVHAMAPEWFPTVRRERTIAVFRFEPVGEKETRVRLAQFGWKEGAEWDKAFDYLAKGNAQLLTTLRRRFTDGPIDWKAVMEKMAAEKK